MTTFKRISLVLLVAGACLAATGCGSDDDEGAPIPAEQADALLAQLDNVQGRLDNGTVGACRDIFSHPDSPNQPTVDGILAQIPRNVDPEVRSALEQSFQRLWDLVDQECDERQPDEPAEPAPDPEPAPEETAPEETETDPPLEVPTDPEEAPLPPEGDGDNDGEAPPGNGNGNGNGNGVGNGGGVGPGGEAGG